jgi:hypothetical protein
MANSSLNCTFPASLLYSFNYWKTERHDCEVFVVSERLDTSVLEVDGCQEAMPIVIPRVRRYSALCGSTNFKFITIQC